MNGIDIALGIPLLYALYKGFRAGIVVQLAGIVGLLIGVYLAYRYGTMVGSWCGANEPLTQAVGFGVILVVVLVAMAIVGRLLRGLFRIAGLGIFDQIGGVLLAFFKVALILSLLLSIFNRINVEKEWVKSKYVTESMLYRPILQLSEYAFPYIHLVKDQLYPEQTEQPTDESDSQSH